MKKVIFISMFCVVLGIATFLIVNKPKQAKSINIIPTQNIIKGSSKEELVMAAKNTTYIIEDKAVTLSDGKSEIESEGEGGIKTTTNYFGNGVISDFNSDGRDDIAFLITQNSGGSGTFYYVVLALNTADGFFGTNGYFIGDRISPQTTELNPGNIILVNYADRKENESFEKQPSVGKTLKLKYDSDSLKLIKIR